MNLKGQLVTELQRNEHAVHIVALDDLSQEYKSAAKKNN